MRSLFIACLVLLFSMPINSAIASEDYSYCENYRDECKSRCQRLDDLYERMSAACEFAFDFWFIQTIRCNAAADKYEDAIMWFQEQCLDRDDNPYSY